MLLYHECVKYLYCDIERIGKMFIYNVFYFVPCQNRRSCNKLSAYRDESIMQVFQQLCQFLHLGYREITVCFNTGQLSCDMGWKLLPRFNQSHDLSCKCFCWPWRKPLDSDVTILHFVCLPSTLSNVSETSAQYILKCFIHSKKYLWI